MTTQSQENWFNTAPGRATDPDGVAGFQCVDTAKDYFQAIFNKPWQNGWPGAGNAKDMIGTANRAYFDVIMNDPNNANLIPQRGDIIVWGGTAPGGLNEWGHIAVVKSANTSSVEVVQQDGFLQRPMWVGTLGYSNPGTGMVLGWLRPKLSATKPPTATLKPNQRIVGKYGVTERAEARPNAKAGRVIDPGQVLDFKGYVVGAKANVSNIWFVGAYAGTYFSADAFNDASVKGLTNLTPKPPVTPTLKPNQKVVGSAVANYRKAPNSKSDLISTYKKGDVLDFSAYTTGEKVNGTDIWFKGAYSGGYISASNFDNPAVGSIPKEAAPKPPVTTPPVTPPVNPAEKVVGTSKVNVRELPFTSAKIVGSLEPSKKITVTGWTTGDEVDKNKNWFYYSEGWVWSGGFTSASTTGIPAKDVPVKPQPPTYVGLNGIDVSGHQNGIDLTKVAGDFVIIKATEGVGWTDPAFKTSLDSARKSGKLVGFYHFARPLSDAGNTAQAEAQSFIDVVKPYIQAGDVLVLDWEAENRSNTAWAREWLTLVFKEFGIKPWVYANQNDASAYDWSLVIGDGYPLWLAQYPVSTPQGYGPQAQMGTIYNGWKVVAWQYSSTGSLSGWNGDLDLNIFFGGVADWKKLGYAKDSTPPVVVPPETNPDTSGLAKLVKELIDLLKKIFNIK